MVKRLKHIFKSKLAFLKKENNNLKYLWTTRNEPKILFLWIPKNAGTSIYTVLNRHISMKKFIDINEASNSFRNTGAVTFGHISIQLLRNKKIISTSYYRKSKIFCVSRNPYDRLISLLHYHKKHNLIPQDYNASDFLNKILEGIPPIGSYNSKDLSLCNPQITWTKGIRVDKILPFENPKEIEKFLSQIIGAHSTLQHINNSPKRKSFMEELDNDSISKINSFYKEDFEFFGYNMIK